MALDDLPSTWTVWDHEPGDRLILAFRPDVFDGSEWPPACLPTIYVREGEADLRRTGPAPASGTEGTWTVTLFLEPAVSERLSTCDDYETAVAAAIDHAVAFDAGEIDFEAIYQVPREAYLAAVGDLVGH